MNEKRVIHCHGREGVQSPHLKLPEGFAPLRLRVENAGTEIEVTCADAIIGRHTDTDLRLGFADISRHHARLVFENGVWRVFDLKSLNGVYVNGLRTEVTTLYAGDIVRIGSVSMLVLAATQVQNTPVAA